jgi:cold-inducible RNA-binding protein
MAQQNRLYVGNISFSSTGPELEKLFSDYGEIEQIRLISDRETGQSRGFAFVTFATQGAAESALEMNGKAIGGRNLIVNMAKEKAGGRKRF